MKNILKIMLLSFITVSFVACDDDDVSPITPSGITEVAAFEMPGEIGLTWKREEPVNFEYIKIQYFDHLTKKDISILASKYTDTVIIKNTRAKYGDYNFTFQPFSSTKTGGNITNLVAKSGPYEAKITVSADGEEVELTEEMLSTDSQEESEGPIKNLIDGDPNTFFHSDWHGQKPGPHSFQINLGEGHEVEGFSFFYKNRATNPNGGFKKLTIQGSNDGTNWTDIIIIDKGLPTDKGAEYTSEPIMANGKYSMFKFVCTESYSGKDWFHMAEFKFKEHEVITFDPENSPEDI